MKIHICLCVSGSGFECFVLLGDMRDGDLVVDTL